MDQIEKPSKSEDEYFAKLDLEKKRQWEKERAAKMAVEERETLKNQHYMKCPKCGMDLHSFDFHGVNVDTCGSCHGVWLDAGEMESIMKREHSFFGRLASTFR